MHSDVTESWLFFFRPNQRANGDAADCLGRGILLRVPLGCRLGLGRWLAVTHRIELEMGLDSSLIKLSIQTYSNKRP